MDRITRALLLQLFLQVLTRCCPKPEPARGQIAISQGIQQLLGWSANSRQFRQQATFARLIDRAAMVRDQRNHSVIEPGHMNEPSTVKRGKPCHT